MSDILTAAWQYSSLAIQVIFTNEPLSATYVCTGHDATTGEFP